MILLLINLQDVSPGFDTIIDKSLGLAPVEPQARLYLVCVEGLYFDVSIVLELTNTHTQKAKVNTKKKFR